ncbi:MAG: ribonuclease HII [Clostridium butyricum]|nr:ribonuclease HII [Clostridium butyricum]
MQIINEEIEKLPFNKIKEIIKDISISESYKSKEIFKVIDLLSKDKRKNVISLSIKLKKELDSYLNEIIRVKEMYSFDKSFGDYKYVAGVDEVGRGPLAGPIVACAVILDLNVIDDDLILYLNDSKKIKESMRSKLAEIIKEKAIAYSISISSNKEIDERGIAFSNNKVFLESCSSLKITPEIVLSDGYLVRGINILNKSVIKGDTKSASIAAASIVAKDYRDTLMKEYSKEYSMYDFEHNVGYGTSKHVEALKKYGMCDIHRKSFLTKLL